MVGKQTTASACFTIKNSKVGPKGQVQCFSRQVGMNKHFLLNAEKNLTQICLVVFEKKCKPTPKK